MLARQFLAAFFTTIASFAMPAFATPQPIDATDLWFNPSESGWGLSVFHQGDTLFASLFVYGPDGQPKWYTASRLAPGPFTFSGPLVEASGPWFGERFDSDAVNRSVVGSMTFTLNDSGATVSYTVNGVQVSKPLVRASLRTINIAGSYYGVLLQPASVSGSEKLLEDQHILLNDNGSTIEMHTASNSTPGCSYTSSSRSQNGEVILASGQTDPSFCVTRKGPWRMAVDPTPHGFVGNFSDAGINDGRIAAALRAEPRLQGTGWANDLWFPASESGWGMNFIEQGDTAFATLFVYDAQHRPRWYSASHLTAMGTQGPGPNWSGALEESTGPYFGATFDATAVQRRVVGSMTFTVDPGQFNTGFLSYTVDGVTVTKRVNRYAFRQNVLTGSYQGHVVMRSDDPRGLSYDDAKFSFDDQGERVDVAIDIYTGNKCSFSGFSIQYGAQRSIVGNCGLASVRIDDLMVTANGFTGTYSGPAGHVGGMITKGHISGARR
jgi:hypothetical protein